MIKERTKQVTLTFLREQLLYDIKTIAYVEADVMRTEDEHQRHQVFDIGEDGNIDRVTRLLDLAIAHCVEVCYPYTKNPVEQETAMDDVLTETDAYVVRMWVPDDFSQTTVTLIERLIHELCVYRVLAGWFLIAYPDKAALWQQKADQTEEDIKDKLNARIGRVRRPLNPF